MPPRGPRWPSNSQSQRNDRRYLAGKLDRSLVTLVPCHSADGTRVNSRRAERKIAKRTTLGAPYRTRTFCDSLIACECEGGTDGSEYALALGAPRRLGAWLGAVLAVLVASSISPTAVALTALVFLVIQLLEGNVLTPRIQGQTIKVPSVVVFLGVIAGGALAGVIGVLFATPTLAVLRVLFDFLRVRLRTEPAAD